MHVLELIKETSPIIGKAGAAFYFHPDTLARGREIGLDGFRFYMLGRGGVLGDAEAEVVASAFGYFHPALVARMWNSARERVAPREAARVYFQCCAHLGRVKLAQVEGLEAFCAAAEKVIAAANPAGLPLYAGIAAQPRVEDLPGRALQLVAVLRELRGSLHLVAVVASGLAPEVAHAIRRPNDVKTFGWDPAPTYTEADRAKLDAAEALTNALLVPPYSALDETARAAFLDGVRAIGAALEVQP
ncbi:MAG: hypothetical protein KatS3mg131_3324 [Candidatus Tectimicrobiota bacterium]|nr:MAG: hypothetical protein KatS3mg131_3324 [Candidatus Tectomicrobia bacterium]